MHHQQSSIKNVVIIGSSGGGGSTISNDVYGLLTCLKRELASANIRIVAVQIVECTAPLDFASSNQEACLWTIDVNDNLERIIAGTLHDVNERAFNIDRAIARMVIGDESVHVDGVISISADAAAVNHQTFRAAAKKQIPLVGTGGTSLGQAAAMNVKVIGNSGGSVSTTIHSKAISFTASLTGYWGLPYNPTQGYFNLVGVLGGCLPAFIGLMLYKRLALDLLPHLPPGLASILLSLDSSSSSSSATAEVSLTQIIQKIIPTIVSIVMASQVGSMGETSVIAGILAGLLMNGPVISGALTGFIAGHLCRYILVATARSTYIPATASTIITSSASGILAGTLGSLSRPVANELTSYFKAILNYLETPGSGLFQTVMGTLIGTAMCYGSQVGAYHMIFLPLICFEMQDGQPSFLGAVDFCSLCLTSAGICAAYWLLPPPSSYCYQQQDHITNDVRLLARRGVLINLCFGDFVEACYPLIEKDILVKASTYLACIISTIFLLNEGAKSSAYLPAPLSLYLAEGKANAAAMVAFALPFTVALLKNLMSRF